MNLLKTDCFCKSDQFNMVGPVGPWNGVVIGLCRLLDHSCNWTDETRMNPSKSTILANQTSLMHKQILINKFQKKRKFVSVRVELGNCRHMKTSFYHCTVFSFVNMICYLLTTYQKNISGKLQVNPF